MFLQNNERRKELNKGNIYFFNGAVVPSIKITCSVQNLLILSVDRILRFAYKQHHFVL